MNEFTITAKPLPTQFRWTPQQLLDAIVERLQIADDKATFVISDVQPTTNVGPWFKNGRQLWVWDSGQGTYVPLDVSSGVLSQVAIQTVAPDPGLYQYWFQISPGPVAGGLYHYLDGQWRKPDTSVAPGSITEEKLADEAASTEKFANGAVTPEKIKPPIKLTKWQHGAANQFARMDSSGSLPVWETFRAVSAPQTLATNTVFEFVHGLGEAPGEAEAWVVALEDLTLSSLTTLPEGTAIPVEKFRDSGSGIPSTLVITPSRVYFRTWSGITLLRSFELVPIPDPSKFAVYFRVTPR